jgi:hypothetical protein
MEKILIAFVMMMVLVPVASKMEAAGRPNHGTPGLNKRHKERRKALKQQQHAAKEVMGKHELSSDEQSRFNHDLASERRTLRKQQKRESHNIKKRGKSAKQSHPTVLTYSP